MCVNELGFSDYCCERCQARQNCYKLRQWKKHKDFLKNEKTLRELYRVNMDENKKSPFNGD